MTHAHRATLGGLLVLAALCFAQRGARAATDHPLCRFAIHEEQVELDDQTLQVELAASSSEAAEEIFLLVEGLWQNQAIERMAYLGFKHDRDLARLELDRQRRLLERQASVVEQVRMQCAAFAAGSGTGESRQAIDAVYRRYGEADCAAQELDVEIGKVDEAFRIEMLNSVRDLRAGDVATRQDVIVAIRDLDMARKRLASATARAATCRREWPLPAN